MSKVVFNNQKKIFFNSLNAKVEAYFKEANLKKTGGKKLYVKSFLLISASIAIYILLLTVPLNPVLAILLCCLFGISQAGIGFNVMHDANHGSYSEKKWINNLMSLTANTMGVNSWLWKQKHNIIHHTYTNIDGIDEDIAKSPVLRMCPSQKQLKMHRYQHVYCLPLYSLSSLMLIINDFSKYFKKKILITPLQKMGTGEHTIFWASKFLYILFYIALPAYFVGLVPAIIGFIIMHLVLGLTLALVFQLAHLVEATHFPDALNDPLPIQNEWAVHQVQTTADFATDNKLISWFAGGLNFQVEHHLFPKISHVHYPAIHHLVKDTCKLFSLRYNTYPTMTSALRSHFRFMRKLGTP